MKKLFCFVGFALMLTSNLQAELIVNGTFGSNPTYNTTGWATSGTVTASAAGATLGSANAFIEQDFVGGDPNSIAAGAIYNFQLDYTFSLSAVSANSTNPTNRIRLEGNAGSDLISTRIASDGIFVFNGLGFGSGLAATIAANTVYHVRVIGSNFNLPSRSYTIGLSTDGVTYTTSGALTGFHGSVVNFDFEHVRFERGSSATAVLTIDNVSAVPEPSALTLAGLVAAVGFIRRRHTRSI